MTLTSEYQYIGRSNGLLNLGGTYHYYLLLYAKTQGSAVTGKHSISLKLRLACTQDVYFMGYPTSAYGKAAGQVALSWVNQSKPNDAWQKALTAGGITYPRWIELGDGVSEVYVGYGVEKQVSLEALFQRLDLTAPPLYLPNTTEAKLTATVTLPALLGATVPGVSATTAELGQTLTITTPAPAEGVAHWLGYRFQGSIGAIAADVKDSHSWTVPMELATQIPNAASGLCTIVCDTYLGGVKIGSATVDLTLTVPRTEATLPAVTMELSPVSTLPAAFAELYIQNLTQVQASLSAQGKLGATVVRQSVTVGAATGEAPFLSGLLTQTGLLSVTASVTDSRGFTGTARQTITVLPYSKPVVLPAGENREILWGRCDEAGNFTPSGTCLRIVAARGYSTLEGKNSCLLRYRLDGGGWSVLLERTQASDAVDTGVMSGITLLPTRCYLLELEALDAVGNSSLVRLSIPTDQVDVHLPQGGGSVALGGYSTKTGFQCHFPAHFEGLVRSPRLLGRHVSQSGALVLENAGTDLLGSRSSAGLLLITDTQEPSRFGFYYYNYRSNTRNTILPLAVKNLQQGSNIYGSVWALDENGNKLDGHVCFTVLPCFAVA